MQSEETAEVVHLIMPYQYEGEWVFDDPRAGLEKEPFISGADTVVSLLAANIPDAAHGFRLMFSAKPFPIYSLQLLWRREEFGGHWYYTPEYDLEGWLFPSLFRYFEDAPLEIYVRAEPRNTP